MAAFRWFLFLILALSAAIAQKGGKDPVTVPEQVVTTDMVPDDPGIWLFQCHVSDHMDGGMIARYQVLK